MKESIHIQCMIDARKNKDTFIEGKCYKQYDMSLLHSLSASIYFQWSDYYKLKELRKIM